MVIDKKEMEKFVGSRPSGFVQSHAADDSGGKPETVKPQKDELDTLLDRLTIPPGFPHLLLRNALRAVLEAIPMTAPIEDLNKGMALVLSTVTSVPAESDEDLENKGINHVLDIFQAHKDEPWAVQLPIHSMDEEKAETKALEIASKLRKLLPPKVWIVLCHTEDTTPAISVIQGQQLSVPSGKEGKQGVLGLIDHTGELSLTDLLPGESWEDCVTRVNPSNDKPLMMFSREEKSTLNDFIIRKRGEPEETDSEGFEYVKAYDDRCLSWTYSVKRAKRFSHAEACDVHRLLKEVQTDSEIVPAPAEGGGPTPASDEQVDGGRLHTVTDDDWTIRKGKAGKFCIVRTCDGLFLQGALVLPESVGYIWAKTEEEARKFDSLAAANEYASEVLLLQTYRGSESEAMEFNCPQGAVFVLPHGSGEVVPKIGRNDPCPCGSGKKWKKCCMGAK